MTATALVLLSAVAFLAIGLALGIYLRRLDRRTAASAAREGSERELEGLRQQVRNEQDRCARLEKEARDLDGQLGSVRQEVVSLNNLLGGANAAVGQVAELKVALEAKSQELARLNHELRDADAQRAEQSVGLRRVPELEAELAERKAVLTGQQALLDREREKLAVLSGELARKTAELEAARRSAVERAADAESTKEQVRIEIQTIASRLLEQKGQAMLLQNREGLDAALTPVREKLREFEAKVDKTYDQENRDRATLLTSLKQLQETQARLHKDAESLARALTGESKTQGDWGELILERVLETAGLTEGREYELQVNCVDEEGGRKRPDALVYLPANRAIIVDAKCSLTAFVASTRAEVEEVREAATAAHLASVRNHMKSLAGKNYQEVLKKRTLDIVLMFIPNEAAFHAAISRDLELYDEAFRQGVVICSPTTLLAALKLISHVWRSEKQNLNAQSIADEAGKLLEKLSAFVKDLDEVGSRLLQAQQGFEAARSKLHTGRGNILSKAGTIVKLGARVRPERIQHLGLEAGADGEEAALDAEDLLPEVSEVAAAAGKARTSEAT